MAPTLHSFNLLVLLGAGQNHAANIYRAYYVLESCQGLELPEGEGAELCPHVAGTLAGEGTEVIAMNTGTCRSYKCSEGAGFKIFSNQLTRALANQKGQQPSLSGLVLGVLG